MAKSAPVHTERPGIDAILKRHFGFQSFRPHQREIVESLLAGDDVLALLPTGGGKSLCYQLPAIANDGLTVVVSPLIALMKDQVDSLEEVGVPATFLNSSLSPEEYGRRWRDLGRRGYKILYLAPERLVTEDMLGALQGVERRPHRRRRGPLHLGMGPRFPARVSRARRPAPAVSRKCRSSPSRPPRPPGSATISSRSFGMKQPRVHVASFNRPNLSYRIVPRTSPLKQVLAILSDHRGESGIIYCMTRKRTEELAEALTEEGVAARAYHAGLDSDGTARGGRISSSRTRSRSSSRPSRSAWASTSRTCGSSCTTTCPRTSRVTTRRRDAPGRDGLPSECVLLYSPSDAVQTAPSHRRCHGRAGTDGRPRHLAKLIEFCESALCRRVQLLQYFGETYRAATARPSTNAGHATTASPRASEIDGTLPAQKFLSCVLRIQQKSGFSVGLHHVVDVLCGAETEKVRKWEHQTLSTYGIGKEHSRSEWAHFARELMRLGLLHQNTEQFNVLEVTPSGREFLKNRRESR